MDGAARQRCLAKKDKVGENNKLKTKHQVHSLLSFIDLINCSSAHEHILKHRVSNVVTVYSTAGFRF